ncbi:MAG TPA: tyrosine-type recombinase/integrase [Acidimicrobiales bacterium]|nr:tyrosine-type recombinase/integrase [Acidimicrobiales bacterium]
MAEVRESLADVSGRLVFGPTKTYGNRSVRLPRFLCDELTTYLSDRTWRPDDLVFTSPTGAPIRYNLFYVRHFKPAVVAAGLPPRLRFHDLRHSCVAIFIAQGAHPKAIMERLGHSTIQVTLDRYERLWSRSSYGSVEVGTLRRAGYELLATFEAPHFDIVLPEASPAAAVAF